VISGGPGAGKTTLLAELSRRGYRTVAESARAIISERLARGEPPRPSAAVFAREILRRDIGKYVEETAETDWVFFDRGALEAIGMLQDASPQPELERMVSTYRFHESVFLLPPWREIFRNDSERDPTFSDAVTVYDRVTGVYRSLGYTIYYVPLASSAQRADFVLQVLGDAQAAH